MFASRVPALVPGDRFDGSQMSDVFREVDEALREDRARALWTRYGRIAVAVAIVVVAATAAAVYWRDQQAERQAAVADRMIRSLVLAEGEPAEAAHAMAMLGDEAAGLQQAVARLLEAAMRQSLGEDDAAARLLGGVAESDAGPAWRDLATLQAALQALAHATEGDGAAAEVTRLAAGEGPWHYAAREIAAIEALTSGDRARAVTLFESLASDETAPPAIRSRAGEMARSLDD